MKIRNVIPVGLLGATLAATVAAQPPPAAPSYYEHQMRHREDLLRRIEADRRAVEFERGQLRRANWFTAGRESRELRHARERLDRDLAELRALDSRNYHR